MAEIFKSFLLTSLFGTILGLVLVALRPVTKKYFSAGWHYYSWLAVLLIMMFPVRINMPDLNIIKEPVTEYSTEFKNYEAQPPVLSQQTPQNLVINKTEEKIPLIDKIKDFSEDKIPAISNIWLIVAVLILLFKILGYILFLIKIHKNTKEVQLTEIENFTKRKVKVRVGGEFCSPLITGIFKPILILPTTDLTNEQLSNILLHEMTHLKRNDILYKWFITFVKCVHWFNPVIYYFSNKINIDCEISCDLAVVATMNEREEEGYVETILSLLNGSNKKTVPLTTGMTGNKETLKQRFTMIKNKKEIRKKVKIISIILAVLIFLASLIAGGIFTGKFLFNDNAKIDSLFELRETDFNDIKNIEKIVKLSNFTPYEFNSIEIFDNGYEKRVVVKFMVEDRAMYRLHDGTSLRKLSALILALVPDTPAVSTKIFDKYSKDLNNWETSFYGTYASKVDFDSREQFKKFTLEYINNATLTKENFKEFYNSLLLIESNEELSDYQKQEYDFIGKDYEVVINSGIGAEFLVDNEFLNSNECDNINKLFNVDLKKYEGLAVNLGKTTIRNFKTNEYKKHIKLYYFEGDSAKFISQKIIEEGKLSDEVKLLIQTLMGKVNGKYIYNAENLSYVQIKALQYQVNNGHFSWRLDPKQVIMAFLSGKGKEVNNIRIPETDVDIIKYEDPYNYEIELFKPIDKSDKGIWIVKSYKKKEKGKVSEILFYERTPEQSVIENKEDGWYRVTPFVRAVFQCEWDLPQKITAYFTPAGTETESLKEEIAKIEAPFSYSTMSQVPYMDINFPDWCSLGHLEFEFDYGEDGKTKSQLYNFLVEQ